MTDLKRLQDAMNRQDVAGIAEALGYGVDLPPHCPICDLPIRTPHPHCDYCESPYVSRCTEPRCRMMCCAGCMREHSKGHYRE